MTGHHADDLEIEYWLALLRDGTSEEKVRARTGLAGVFERRGMLEEATDLLAANIVAGAADAETYRRLARLYRQQGQGARALEAAAEAARRMPQGVPSSTLARFGSSPSIQRNHSAAPARRRSGGLTGCAVVFFLVTMSLVVLAAIGSATSGGPRAPSDGEARLMCEKFVTDRLRAPATASFAGSSATTVTKSGDDTFRVRSYVDAQNGFGANIRTHYTCVVRPIQGTDRWQLESLDM